MNATHTESESSKVYFICRSQYEVPLGHRIVEFDDDASLLNWFQKHWITDDLWAAAANPTQTGAFVRLDKPESEWEDGDVLPIYDTDVLEKHFDELLNGGIYGINAFWEAMAKWGKKPPRNERELEKFVRSIDYYGTLAFEQGAIQVQTDDDEIELALYMFDEAYARAHPQRTSFLIRKDWQLPEDAGEEGKILEIPSVKDLSDSASADSKGAVYCAFLSAHDGMTLLDITGCFRISGVRLPEFGEFLVGLEPHVKETSWAGERPVWPEELILARALLKIAPNPDLRHLLNSLPADELIRRWSQPGKVSNFTFSKKDARILTGTAESIRADFLEFEAYLDAEKQGRNKNSYWVHTPQNPLVQVSDHMCQIRFHDLVTAKRESSPLHSNSFFSYIFFDDLWIAANPDLAESILHYGGGWDCLYSVKDQ